MGFIELPEVNLEVIAGLLEVPAPDESTFARVCLLFVTLLSEEMASGLMGKTSKPIDKPLLPTMPQFPFEDAGNPLTSVCLCWYASIAIVNRIIKPLTFHFSTV